MQIGNVRGRGAGIFAVVAVVGIGLAGLSVFAAERSGVEFLAGTLMALLVFWIAVVDARSFTIPDAALVPMAVLAILVRWQDPVVAFDPALGLLVVAVDGLVAGGCVLLVREAYYRRHGVDGIGFGDVKLAAVGGLLCGLAGFSLALLSASLCALAWAAVPMLRGTTPMSKLPFGTFLAPALLVVWALGQTMPDLSPHHWRL